MKLCNLLKTCAVLALLLTLSVACGAEAETAPTVVPVRDVQPTQAPAPSETPPPPPSATPTPPEPTPTPLPTEAPTWYGAGTVALFSVGDYESGDLYALGGDGATQLVFSDVGRDARVSPDGRWLGFVRVDYDGRSTLELHDAQTGASRHITSDATGGMLRFAFDRTSRRLAYLHLDPPDEDLSPWGLVVVDLKSDTAVRYDTLMTFEDRSSLPGVPVGWSGAASSGDELILDTFMPFSEGGWAGVWAVILRRDGAPAAPNTLSRRELLPAAPVYFSSLYFAPDGQSLAFLGRDLDYVPENYFPEFYDLAVNRLETVALSDGARTLVVGVDDGSALARVLAWSPGGKRLLFAQGSYGGSEYFDTLTLKSSDLSGAVVEHGMLTLPPMSYLSDMAWCVESHALYVAWGNDDNTQRLFSVDLNAAISTELSAGPLVEILACAP